MNSVIDTVNERLQQKKQVRMGLENEKQVQI